MKKTPAILALALALLTTAVGCSGSDGPPLLPSSDGSSVDPGTGDDPGNDDGSGGPGDGSGGPGDGSGDGGGSGGGSGSPALPTAPPADGTTAWAPAASDATYADVRAFGAVGNGYTDDTAAFRAAAATGKIVFVPAPPAAYVLTRYVQLRNSIYGDGSLPLIKMVGADGDPDQGVTRNMLFVSGYRGDGLVIQGLHLDGQWNGGGNGEWGHVVNVRNSSNVTIQHNVIERAYGDDVFVGEFGGTPSGNVVIQQNTLRDPRRCNVAVNSGDGVVIRNNRIEKSGDYVSAIDLEPDPLGFQYVRRVTIDSNTFAVATQAWGAGAISLNNPRANASAVPSGDVTITNNRGTWTSVYTYMDVGPGGGGLVGVVPGLTWYNLVVTNNSRS